MPDDEGLALHDAGLAGGAVGPLLEVGTYCGKSAVYLGAAAREAETVCFTVDHHRGSEENQAGWDHHDPEVVDPETGRMDTLPFFRRTIYAAGLEDVVVAVVGYSIPVARGVADAARLPVHRRRSRRGRRDGRLRRTGRRTSRRGGVLAIHDVFEDPADGGQAPFHVWQRAVADGFTPVVDHRFAARAAQARLRIVVGMQT